MNGVKVAIGVCFLAGWFIAVIYWLLTMWGVHG